MTTTTQTSEPTTAGRGARLQLALNVSDLDAAVERYSALLNAEPNKVRPGYANFALEDPPLKLVLIERADARPGEVNHLGVEVNTTEAVIAETQRLARLGLETRTEEGTECCYALQDKVWVEAPDGIQWEVYTVLGDVETLTPVGSSVGDDACCASDCCAS